MEVKEGKSTISHTYTAEELNAMAGRTVHRSKDDEGTKGEIELTELWHLYQAGKEYNNKLNIYNVARKNETFAYGNQWEGVDPKGLPTPQFNIFRRVIDYMVSFLTSSPLKIRYTAKNVNYSKPDENEKQVLEAIDGMNKLVMAHFEDNKINDMLEDLLRDGAVTGDMAGYVRFDSSIETGHKIKGDFVTERTDGTNILFGNPNDKRVNYRGKPFQPYILADGRDTVGDLKAEARRYAKTPEEGERLASMIMSDKDLDTVAGERGRVELDGGNDTDKATYVIKWYPKEVEVADKDGKKVKKQIIYWCKSTANAVVVEEQSTKLGIYPVFWENWFERKNSYHGSALITNAIPNQKYVNKQMALIMAHYMRLAIPKILYDKSLISGWSNKIGSAIGVKLGASKRLSEVAMPIKGPDMPNNVIQIVETAVRMTIESLGANEVLLGNVKPDNTSAIIQVTEQAGIPLLSQKKSLLSIVEQMAEIYLEYVKAYFVDEPERKVAYKDVHGKQVTKTFNPGHLLGGILRPDIEVGPSTWWNENASVTTLDKLLESEIINQLQYLTRMPEGRIPDKEELILDKKKEMGILDEEGNPIEAPNMQDPAMMEDMGKFFDSLPDDMQQKLQALPDAELEKALMELMQNPQLLQ